MRCLILFVTCALVAFAGARQIVVTKVVDAGASNIQLSNTYDSAATAWIVGCENKNAKGKWVSQWHWSDQQMGVEGKPLEAGAETWYAVPIPPDRAGIPVGMQNNPCKQFQLLAAVFADGTVTGDLAWINAIAAERQRTYRNIAEVIEVLTKAISDGADTESAVNQVIGAQEKAGIPARPGKTANYGESNGWRSEPGPGGPGPVNLVPSRPFPRSAAYGVALWLIQQKKKTLPEAVAALSEWREELGKWDAVKGPALPEPERMMSTSAPTPGMGRMQAAVVGKPAQDFTLKDVDGKELTLSSLRGKTVLLDFWATWCEPCRKAMPDIQAVYEAFHDKDLEVVCVDYSEGAAVARKYFEDNKYSFRSLLDPDKVAFDKYGGGGIPKTLIIDKDGVVRFFHPGYSSNEDFMGEVRGLMK